MNHSRWLPGWTCLLLSLAWAALALPAQAQHGFVLSGGGPVNRSMGGTATAAPLDAIGALFWNPATLSGLKQSELSAGAEVLMVHPTVSSSVSSSAFGPGIPPVTLRGSTNSDSAAVLLPNVGLSHRLEDTPFTFGFGLLTAGGFSTNYPASTTNPILTPQPPNGLGLGAVSVELQVYQITPAVSVQLTDHLSVGGGPILDFVSLRADPYFFNAPNDANGDGFATYSPGMHTPFNLGAGFQAGAYLTTDAGWNFGASFKSPQWLEKFRYNSTDELGRPRQLSKRFNFPMIGSLGASYTGFERWLMAADVRYIGFGNTAGLDETGFARNGAVRGIGWDNVFVATLGAQYEMSDRISVRGGYSFNTSPQDGAVAAFNVGAPTIIEHTVYTGVSMKLSCNLLASLTYIHAFENSVEGPIASPFGPVPGTSVKNTVSADALTFGVTVRY